MPNVEDMPDFSKTPSPHSGVNETVEANLLTNPLPYFQREARELISHLPLEQQRRLYKRVRVCGRQDLGANAECYARRWKCLGYEIAINQGWTKFLIDSVWLFLARTKVVTPDGTTSVNWDVSHVEAETMLRETVGSYVTRNPQWTTSPELLRARARRVELESTLPSTQHRDWALWVLRMIRFTVAHELGHIVHDHFYAHTSNPMEEWSHEYEADQIAAELLVASIRARYPANDEGAWARIGDQLISVEDLDLVTAFDGVAIMFTVQDLLQTAARTLHKAGRLPHHWETSHPPARKRYQAFRQHCITSCSIRPELFSHTSVGLPPPDHVQESLYLLALDVSWLDEPFPDLLPDGSISTWAFCILASTSAETAEDPTSVRRRIDRVRQRLEAEWNKNDAPEPKLLDALVQSCLLLSALCRHRLELPEDSLLYCNMGSFYLSHLEQFSGEIPAHQVRLLTEITAARKQLGRLSPEEELIFDIAKAHYELAEG
jgi:hypothetical protein